MTAVWPQGRNSFDEKQRYVVFESNLFMGDEVRNGGIRIHANDIVIRNNIFVNFDVGVGIGDDTVVGPSKDMKVYKSAYGLDTHSTIEDPNLVSVDVPAPADPLTPLVPPEELAKPKANANAHVSQCKDLPNVALDFNGRLRSHPTQCGAVGFTPDP